MNRGLTSILVYESVLNLSTCYVCVGFIHRTSKTKCLQSTAAVVVVVVVVYRTGFPSVTNETRVLVYWLIEWWLLLLIMDCLP